MDRPTAAKGTFPYRHRTVAQIEGFLADIHAITDCLPHFNEWVLGYLPRQDPAVGKRCGFRVGRTGQRGQGWVPMRFRPRGWQAQFGSYRTYIRDLPAFWTPILPAEPLNDARRQIADRDRLSSPSVHDNLNSPEEPRDHV